MGAGVEMLRATVLLAAMLHSVATLSSEPGDLLLSRLERAAALFRQGLLSEAEFSGIKRQLLAPALPQLKTFGTGSSAMIINTTEQLLFEHTVSTDGSTGVMTHFWITGLERTPAGEQPKYNSNGTDDVIVRYYIDGEQAASIEFKPPMAAGVGFSDAAANGDPTGMS